MTEWKIRDAWKWGILEGGPELLDINDCILIGRKASLEWSIAIEKVHACLNTLSWRCASLAFLEGQELRDWQNLRLLGEQFLKLAAYLNFSLDGLDVNETVHRLEHIPRPNRGPRPDWRTKLLGNATLCAYHTCTSVSPAAGVAHPTYRFVEEFGKAVTPALKAPVWSSAADVETVRRFWRIFEKFSDGKSKPPIEKWVADYVPNNSSELAGMRLGS